jgi:transcription termination/antitermination protein NusG
MLEDVNDNGRKWYAIQTYSGYEKAVERNLKQKVSSEAMGHKIFDVLVPLEKVVKIKNGKKVEIEQNFYPGYVLVDMIADEESWYIVRNTPRVTGFVGAGTVPVALTSKEIELIFSKLKNSKTTHTIKINVGDNIVITDGPFKTMEGKVEALDEEKGKLKVNVNMFGRETPVELDYLQVKPV